MRSAATFLAGWLLWSGALAGARQDLSAPQPFRAGVDVIQLDVSVLDKNRRPVPRLAAADFTVLVDGLPRPVVAFRAVELPTPAPPPALWMRDVAPDVATNTHPGGRVVVIMIDDGSLGQKDDGIDVRAVQKTRDIARAALLELGPDDLAAVVYTENNHTAQNFTTDRRRLLAAIETSALFPGPRTSVRPLDGMNAAVSDMLSDPFGLTRGSCYCGVCSIEALGRIAEALRSLPQQRKIVIYISVGSPVGPDLGKRPEQYETYKNLKLHCNLARRAAMTEVFRQAQLANVTIQAVDPKGLVIGDVGGDLTTNPTFLRVEFLRTMAETTGGRAVVNDNEMERQVSSVLAESSSYYLLGVESGLTKDDGRFHPIHVRVNRPGLDVRTRTGYYAPTEKERRAMATSASRGLDTSIAGALPKSDFPMDVSVAPFAGANRKADVAVVLTVTQPTSAAARSENSRWPLRGAPSSVNREPVDLVASAFSEESGKALGSWRQRLNLAWNATDATSGQYEVLSRLPMPSGRYEVRLGVKTADERSASVYTYVDVPDFAGESLSLSGMILSAIPSPKLASRDGFMDLMPLAPTARRVFRQADRVTAFLRVYQGGSHPLAPATITTRLIDSASTQVGDGLKSVEAASFGKSRSFDNRFDLPVRLPRGEYLLTVDVAAGGKTIQRAVRFRVE